jgi:hypothetical protein
MPSKAQNMEGVVIQSMSTRRAFYTNCMSGFLRNIDQKVLCLLLKFKDTEVERKILGQ